MSVSGWAREGSDRFGSSVVGVNYKPLRDETLRAFRYLALLTIVSSFIPPVLFIHHPQGLNVAAWTVANTTLVMPAAQTLSATDDSITIDQCLTRV